MLSLSVLTKIQHFCWWQDNTIHASNCLHCIVVPQQKWNNTYGHSRVQFNDLRFVFHSSSWSFQEPYFWREYVFHKSYKVSRTQDYHLKTLQNSTRLLNIVLISKAFLSTISNITCFFIQQKFCKYHFLQSWKKIEKTRQLTIQKFSYCLIYSGARKAFCKSM